MFLSKEEMRIRTDDLLNVANGTGVELPKLIVVVLLIISVGMLTVAIFKQTRRPDISNYYTVVLGCLLIVASGIISYVNGYIPLF